MEKQAVDFTRPFPGKNPGDPLTHDEIVSAVRLALCAEEEATHLYDSIADYVKDERVSKLMRDVAEEEKVHAGEFQRLLSLLVKGEMKLKAKGEAEAQEKVGGEVFSTAFLVELAKLAGWKEEFGGKWERAMKPLHEGYRHGIEKIFEGVKGKIERKLSKKPRIRRLGPGTATPMPKVAAFLEELDKLSARRPSGKRRKGAAPKYSFIQRKLKGSTGPLATATASAVLADEAVRATQGLKTLLFRSKKKKREQEKG